MSNSDLPGPYWQQQDESGYRGGRRARSANQDPYDPWDDGRTWRGQGGGRGDSQSGGRGASGPRHSRGAGQPSGNGYGNGNGHAAGNGNGSRHAAGNGNGSGREAPTWTGMIVGRARSRQRQPRDSRWREWTDQFSQTADDLRNRLGMRGSAAGRAAQGAPGRRGAYGADFNGSPTGVQQREDYWQGGRTGQLTGTRTAIRRGTGVGGMGPGGGRGPGGGNGGGRWNGRYPRGAGDRFRAYLRSGNWWRHWTVKKVLGLVGVGIAGVILLMVAAFFIIYANTKIPTASELTANWQSSVVYFSNGTQLGTFDSSQNGTSVDRLLLTSNQVPTVMTQAITAAEDRHFYTEGGVSLSGLARAAYEDVFGHGNLQGGSTITMQYAKNYYTGVNTGQNLTTKLKEVIIAMKLGHERSKAWVMTNYLNTVDFGGTNLGLGAAAENYFNVDLTNPHAQLTISQAAMLAAMPNSPGFFNPSPTGGAGYTALVARWKYVLQNMVRDGNITWKQYHEQIFPALTPPPAGNGESGITGYLMSMVQQQLEAPVADGGFGLTAKQINTGGYRINTTIDPTVNQQLFDAINGQTNPGTGQMTVLARQEGMANFQGYDRLGAVLINPTNGAIEAVYGGPGYGTPGCSQDDCWVNNAESPEPVGSSFKPYVLSEAVTQGMNVFTSQLNGFSPIWIPDSPANKSSTELALSPTSPPTGVSAQANGGYSGNTYYFKFDEQGENSGRPLAVNVAAAISSDPAFEDLAHRDGIQNVINMAQLFGVGQNAFVAPCSVAASQSPNATQAEIIQDCNDLTGSVNGLNTNFGQNSKADTAGSPAIALGENPLTPVEQATTFATLADDGMYHTPHIVATLTLNGNQVANHYVSRQVLSKAAAADVDWALSFDNNMSGATAEANVPFRRGGVIGKTGTLGVGQVASQAWFNGATPGQDALSIDLFTNDPATENLDNLPTVGGTQGSQGGGWPATIWNAAMQTIAGNTQAAPMWPTVQAGFAKWIQVQQQNCNNFQQFQQSQQQAAQGGQASCTCPNNQPNCGFNPNPGGGHGNGNGGGNGPSPSPSTSCQFAGGGGGPNPCNTLPPAGGGGGTTTAFLTPSSGTSGPLVLLAEEATSATRLMVAT